MKEKFNITGMTCSACSARVEKAMAKLDGVQTYTVNLLTNSMSVEYNEDSITTSEMIQAVEKAGYGASLVSEKREASIENSATTPQEHDDFAMRLWVSFCCLIPLMYVSMGHMVGAPLPDFLVGHANAVGFAMVQFLLTLPICYVNRHYFFNGFRALFHASANMDSLIAIGSAAALLYGVFAIFRIGYGLGIGDHALVERYHMDLYFESCATILSLITLGKFFEAKSKGKTSQALKKLLNLAPKTALVVRDGVEVELPCEQLEIGDIVVVKPGASIAVDGEVVNGHSFVDQSAITGESIPVEKQVGDRVISATINQNGALTVRARKVGGDTMFSQIVTLVEEASSTKAPIAKLADRISGVFVPVVIGIAVLTTVVWTAMGYPFEHSLSFGITVLVISCPCALGLATPVAIMVGTGKGAECGILVKSGEALEHAHNVDTVILDKTGTITQGKPKVTEVVAIDCDEGVLVSIAYGLEQSSEHPIASAICNYATERNLTPIQLEQFKAISGRGVTATQGEHRYLGGNEGFMHENKVEISTHQEKIDNLAKQGTAPLLFAKDNNLIGIIAVADPIKEGSAQAIAALREMGLAVLMVTGDNEKTANYIARDLHLTQVIAEVLPQDKEEIVRRYQGMNNVVAMVGDGINDAPALMRADVGIAMASGTDIAMESGDIVLMNSDLNAVVTAISLSKKVISNIKQNLFWAFFYNCLGIPLAAGLLYLPLGLRLTPMFGAMAMSMSSLFVVSNALRLRQFQGYQGVTPKEDTTITKEIETMITLEIEGMMCAHCVNHVTKALTAVQGAQEVTVDLEQKKATIKGDNALLDNLKNAVVEAGYEVTASQVQG